MSLQPASEVGHPLRNGSPRTRNHKAPVRPEPRPPGFDGTSLSLSHKLHGGDEAALEELCSRYWYPLYTWLLATRLARSESNAQDMVQSFIAKMLAQGTLAVHAPERGCFRSYLLRCLKQQVMDQLRRPALAPAEPTDPDADPLAQIEHTEPTDAAFEKAWAWDVFEAAKILPLEVGEMEILEALRLHQSHGSFGIDGPEARERRSGASGRD